MARPKKSRKICNPPIMKGYRPYGMPACKTERIKLSYEGYESIRLINYEGLSQEEAAKMMQISRPTVTRIYNKALKIISKGFVEGKAIEIDGGNYEFEGNWYKCRKCHKLIKGRQNHTRCTGCNVFSENELIYLNNKNN